MASSSSPGKKGGKKCHTSSSCLTHFGQKKLLRGVVLKRPNGSYHRRLTFVLSNKLKLKNQRLFFGNIQHLSKSMWAWLRSSSISRFPPDAWAREREREKKGEKIWWFLGTRRWFPGSRLTPWKMTVCFSVAGRLSSIPDLLQGMRPPPPPLPHVNPQGRAPISTNLDGLVAAQQHHQRMLMSYKAALSKFTTWQLSRRTIKVNNHYVLALPKKACLICFMFTKKKQGLYIFSLILFIFFLELSSLSYCILHSNQF